MRAIFFLLALASSTAVFAADQPWLLVSASPAGDYKCSTPPVVDGFPLVPEVMIDVRKVCRVDQSYPAKSAITLTCASPDGLFRLAYSKGSQAQCESFARWLAAEASKEAGQASRKR